MDKTRKNDHAEASDGEILREVVRRIVAVAKPDKIVLFGSAARYGLKQAGDLDLLVVKSGAHRRRLAQAICRSLIGVGRPVDIVVVRPDDIELTATARCLSSKQRFATGKLSMPPERYRPDGPRAWLARANSDSAIAGAHQGRLP